jgi:hypothetical protein
MIEFESANTVIYRLSNIVLGRSRLNELNCMGGCIHCLQHVAIKKQIIYTHICEQADFTKSRGTRQSRQPAFPLQGKKYCKFAPAGQLKLPMSSMPHVQVGSMLGTSTLSDCLQTDPYRNGDCVQQDTFGARSRTKCILIIKSIPFRGSSVQDPFGPAHDIMLGSS